jgi:hypothetical protein
VRTAGLKNNVLILIGVSLIGFGVFNLSTAGSALAQQPAPPETSSSIAYIIIERLLAEIGPVVGGAVAIAIQFARKQGLKISAEAEEYLVNSVKSFVANQSRMLYKEIRDNPQYKEALLKGRIPPELGKKAKDSALQQLRVELRSDEFTKTAREMLEANLDILVERYVTENKKELAERVRKLLAEMVPVAVSAALLQYNSATEAQKEKDMIISEALDAVGKLMDTEELLFSSEDAVMMIKSELNKRIGNVK